MNVEYSFRVYRNDPDVEVRTSYRDKKTKEIKDNGLVTEWKITPVDEKENDVVPWIRIQFDNVVDLKKTLQLAHKQAKKIAGNCRVLFQEAVDFNSRTPLDTETGVCYPLTRPQTGIGESK